MCPDAVPEKTVPMDSEDLKLLSPENLIKNAPFSFVVLDKDMNIRSASSLATSSLIKPKDGLIGKSIATIYPGYTHEITAICKVVFSTGKPHVVEVSVKRSSGNEQFSIACYFPIQNKSGETRFVFVILQDITDRKKGEYSDIKQSKVFQSIIENLPEDFFMADRDGFLLRWNKNFEALTGYSTEELSKLRISDLLYHSNPDEFWERFEKMFLMGKGTFKSRILRKDGEKISRDVTGVIQEIDGKPIMIGLAFDPRNIDAGNTSRLSAFYETRKLKKRLEMENLYLREEIDLKYRHTEIIGESKAIKRVLRQVEQVAQTDSTVLLTGETGTGKELIARSIHSLSDRKVNTMVKVNCAALPGDLMENELFGHERGAFTGAMTQQIGRFEVANSSTIFLDEVGELPLELQAKLLRVLQEGNFERLGGSKTIKTDVRVIAATNRNLEKEVQEGRFREDLYYRLNVFPINVPPLKERIEDIPLLVWEFVREFGEKMGKTIEQIPQNKIKMLQRYEWKGNIRELRNIIERAMIVTTGPILKIEPLFNIDKPADTVQTLAELEKNHILNILERTNWRIRGNGRAADLLGLKPTTLEFRMKKHGIKR